MIRVRFAPSPTGALHVGGARTALFNYLLARSGSGKFILRIDDTDIERSRPEFEADIFEGLRWLGIQWDEGPDVGGPYGPYRQKDRREIHMAAAEMLIDRGYAAKDSEGVVRLRYPDRDVVVDDIVCGKCVFHPASLGPEPVLIRSDGNPTYHLASVSDDIEMRITHVVRGQDHLTNTAKHVLMFEGLGAQTPHFAHLPLILGTDGSKLSKRNTDDVTTVAEFREAGYLPEALANFLFLLGWSHPAAKEKLSIAEAVAAFSLERVGKTASVFETNKLDWLNGQWIREISSAELAEALRPFAGDYRDVVQSLPIETWRTVAALVQGEIHSLREAPRYLRMIFDESLPLSENARLKLESVSDGAELREVIGAWRVLLSDVPTDDGADCYDRERFSKLVSALKKQVSVQGRALFAALRIAVTGDLSGPDLQSLSPLIPRRILLARAEEALRMVAG